MIDRSLARNPAPFTLFRVHPDGREEPVEGTTTTDEIEAIEHGRRLCRLEPASAFSLYRGERRVAKFNHKALVPRLGLGRVGVMAGALS